MFVFGVVEGGGWEDFGGDGAVAGGGELLLVGVAGGFSELAEFGVGDVDAGAVLGAVVVALAEALGWVVAFPEGLEELLERYFFGVVDDADDFVVAGESGADFAVGGVGGVAGGVADLG